MYSSLTSLCPHLMTLGQTRWCNRVTHGATLNTHTRRHVHTPNDLWTCIRTHIESRVPWASQSLAASYYSPLVRCIWESVWGHPSPANKWGKGVRKREADRRRGAVLTPAPTHTHSHHPGGIDCSHQFTFGSVTSPTMCLFTQSLDKHPHRTHSSCHAHNQQGR